MNHWGKNGIKKQTYKTQADFLYSADIKLSLFFLMLTLNFSTSSFSDQHLSLCQLLQSPAPDSSQSCQTPVCSEHYPISRI